jgi:PAS domain S-box-containing protein
MADDTQRLIGVTLLGEAIDRLEGVAVFVWNDERRYVAVNEEACRLVGLSRDELIGMPVGTLTPDGGEPQMESLRGRGAVDGAHFITRADGEKVQLSWTTAPTRIAGLPYLVSVCRRVV